ncbi:MAG TPA: glycosyltransferase family 4 protein [Nitrolancea sp.]|nr:glycosyltransferase family 4 protein [Nitrolancea sp.]
MRILFVTPSLPSLPRGGASRRMQGLITGLAREHAVSVLAFVQPEEDQTAAIAAARDYCDEVVTVENERYGLSNRRKRVLQMRSLASSKSFEHLVYYRPALQAALDLMLARTRYDIVNVEFCWMGYPRFSTAARIVLDEHNIEYDILRRTAHGENQIARKLYNTVDFRKLRREERAIWRKFDACCLTSERDERLLRHDLQSARTAVVPNGADTAFFRPQTAPPEPLTIAFFGQISYYPNTDGLLFFLREVMPRLKLTHPRVKLLIIGPSPPDVISAYEDDDVIITGVVDDIRLYLERASAIIAPLRIGGGTRLKILEAMAMGKPVVSTHIGAEGIDVTDGQDILLADTAEEFAARVAQVLDDTALAHRLGDAARRLIEQRYDWQASVQQLAHLYQELLPAAVSPGRAVMGKAE